jgi:hypothetical protein
MMVVLYTAQDGRQMVITPAPGVTPEQAASAVPAGLSWQVVDSADVPPEPAPDAVSAAGRLSVSGDAF